VLRKGRAGSIPAGSTNLISNIPTIHTKSLGNSVRRFPRF
jgi:hypothetical protein